MDDSGINARLTVALTATLDQFRKDLRDAGKAADAALYGIEQRSDRSKRRLAENLEMIRLTQQLDVARASGNKGVVEQLEREVRLRQVTAQLQRAGIKDLAAAKAEAQKYVDALSGGHAKGGAFSRTELMELAHVARSAADALAAGANPLRVMAMEGGRVAQALGNAPGGVAGGLAALLGLLNPVTVGLAALAVIVAGLTAAEVSYEGEHRKLLISLMTTAAASGLTVESLEAIATATEKVNHQSATTNRSLAAMFGGSGVEGAANIEKATALVEDFAVATGQKVPDAAKELAKALQKPEQGVKALNEVVRGFVSGEQMRLIEQFAATGREAEAQKIILDALKQTVGGTADQMTGLSKMLRDIARGFDDAKEAAGGFIAKLMGYHGVDELPGLRKTRDQWAAQANDARLPASTRLGARSMVDSLNKQIAPLEAEEGRLGSASGRAQANVASQHLEELIRKGDPQREKIEGLQKDIADLKRARDEAAAAGRPTDRLDSAIRGTQSQLARAQRREDGRAPRAGRQKTDETAGYDTAASESLDAAIKSAAQAYAALTTSVNAKAADELTAIRADRSERLERLAKQAKDINDAAKAGKDANAKVQLAQIAKAEAEVRNAAEAKAELVERNRLAAIVQQSVTVQQLESKAREQSLQNEETRFQLLASLTGVVSEREEFERRALDAAQAREREQADAEVARTAAEYALALALGDAAKLVPSMLAFSGAVTNRDNLTQRQDLQRQQQDAKNLSPWERFKKEGSDAAKNVGDALQSETVKAMDRLNQGVSQAIANGQRMGDVFKSVFRQMEADAISYLLKQAEIGIGSSLESSLKPIVHLIPGFAAGTNSAPGGLAVVGERGPELVNLPKGSQVIPNIGLRAVSAASAVKNAGGSVTVIQPHYNDFTGAVVTDDLIHAMDQRAAAAAQAGAAAGHRMTMDTLNRRQRNRLG